ncbi:MAG: GIY-YIG nuclease family protein [Nitrospiraceae bacterium]
MIKRCAEYISRDSIDALPRGLRGIYVLYQYRSRTKKYDVVYVGMARAGRLGGIKGRLKSHRKNKAGMWSHCSVFEVWDNIREEEVEELEGLFRHIYRRDSGANKLNTQRAFKKMQAVDSPEYWNWKHRNAF